MALKIHPLADVQATQIGDGTFIWQFSVVLAGAVIGSNVNINCNCFVENHVVIGNNVTVKSGVQIWDGVEIGHDVFIGPNATFTNDHVPRSKNHSKPYRRTIINNNASIGANATIVAGNTIGQFAFVGAGSVITKDVPAYTVWYGNPAKHMGYITPDAVILDINLHDKLTGEKYHLVNNIPIKND